MMTGLASYDIVAVASEIAFGHDVADCSNNVVLPKCNLSVAMRLKAGSIRWLRTWRILEDLYESNYGVHRLPGGDRLILLPEASKNLVFARLKAKGIAFEAITQH